MLLAYYDNIKYRQKGRMLALRKTLNKFYFDLTFNINAMKAVLLMAVIASDLLLLFDCKVSDQHVVESKNSSIVFSNCTLLPSDVGTLDSLIIRDLYSLGNSTVIVMLNDSLAGAFKLSLESTMSSLESVQQPKLRSTYLTNRTNNTTIWLERTRKCLKNGQFEYEWHGNGIDDIDCSKNTSRDLNGMYTKLNPVRHKTKNAKQSDSTILHNQDGQPNASNNTDDGPTHTGLIITMCALAFIVALSAVVGIVMFKRGQIVWTGFHGAGTDTEQIHKLPSAATLKTQNWSSINSSYRFHHYEDVEDDQKYESIDPVRNEHQYRTVWTVDQSTDYNDLGPRTDSHKYKSLCAAPKISPNKPW
ncbi:uncharacterized protein LOC128205270 isoform X2 [Mya arenaria]|uniref:uncharacterized protein LOC128205270 isoform X2 n=1 Tax=Mya arenaria TaxID=6604 RepID=UPI0022E3B1C9|nr:uncharacterized protein LOC128205270 isoform X2 [Mya arenaria]